MKALAVGDLHISDRPPSIRIESYADDLFAKLEQVVEIAEAHDVDAVVFAGDVFHFKEPRRTSHELVARLARLGKRFKRWLIVPGNHDIRHDRLETIPSQPLGVLAEAGATILDGPDPGGLPIFGVPWQQRWNREVLGEYAYNVSMHTPELIVAHAPIVKPGRQVPWEFIDAADWARMFERATYFGHHHWCDGVFEYETALFCNQGALSRGSIHEKDLNRKPAVTLWHGDVKNFERVEISHRPPDEVFRIAVHREEMARKTDLEEFLSTVGEARLETLSVEEVLAHVEGLGETVTPETRAVIHECLEHALTRSR